MRDEVVRVGALQHHDPGPLVRFENAEQSNQVAYQFRPDQVHRRSVNHHAQHTLVAPGDAQRAVFLGHRRLLHSCCLLLRDAGLDPRPGR